MNAPRSEIIGYWDYVFGEDGARIVLVDENGARVLECADTPGDQLKHIACDGGPCRFGGAA